MDGKLKVFISAVFSTLLVACSTKLPSDYTLAYVGKSSEDNMDLKRPIGISYRVVDETGKPVKGAAILTLSNWRKAKQKGSTNLKGRFFYKDIVGISLGCRVQKRGHYDSLGDVWTHVESPERLSSPFVVTLKRIIDPVPMVHRSVTLTFPRLNEAIGYDLEVADWVEPDGKGKVSDITVTARKDFISWDNYDFRVMIEFPGELNGIQSFEIPAGKFAMKSALIPPQVAPLTGYSRSFEAWIGRPQGGQFTTSADEKQNHIFRVRAKCDEAGEIVSANVGWIEGPINTTPTEKDLGKCYFKYYWNPDPTSRSLEPKETADRQGIE